MERGLYDERCGEGEVQLMGGEALEKLCAQWSLLHLDSAKWCCS